MQPMQQAAGSGRDVNVSCREDLSIQYVQVHKHQVGPKKRKNNTTVKVTNT
jgi:hypothetical protein